LDVFPDESNLVLVQEYLPSDLAEVVEQSTAPIPRANFKRYAFMLLDALNYIHRQGIIHRVRGRLVFHVLTRADMHPSCSGLGNK
jgi:serine/threonine protein kinase